MPRKQNEMYPDYSAEIKAIDEGGITPALLYRIIRKHLPNAKYNKKLYERYEAVDVPIFAREPRFDDPNAINNRINNDFYGEIIDFKTGYFAGNPIAYSYSDTSEGQEDTGGENARDLASKALTDFTTRNNMYDVDMEVTKFASICGYSGRLFYHDENGDERVMPVEPFETIVLSDTNISEPKYGVRYYKTTDINDKTVWNVEFYDSERIRFYTGHLSALVEDPAQEKQNLYDNCPLQGIPNNAEMLGDAEKVMELIDAYDRGLSDANNESESFANAYMVFENVQISDDEITQGQRSGAFKYFTGGSVQGNIHFLTKDINDTFIEHHLDRIEENIYRFSKTPNLNDEAFGNATGVALRFKLTGLETKCGMFEAKMITAGNYMFKLLAASLAKKRIAFDPLQCVMDFSRNFPLDTLNEAQTVQALINAGLPKRLAYSTLSMVDDVDFVMDLIDEEKESIPSLMNFVAEDDEDEETDETAEE